jgi:hypothetical protein
MNREILKYLSFYFLISIVCCASKAEGRISIYDLRCEHLTDPLGIDVETPRFSWKLSDPAHHTVIIRPTVIEKLSYAKAGLESPYGLIESGWHKENGKIIYDITVPAGSKAEVHFPAPVSEIIENGKPLAKAAGIKAVEENGHSVINMESGKYRFEISNN